MMPFQAEFPIGDPVDESLHEERRQERRHHFDGMVHEPAGDVFVGEGVELQVDFPYDPHLGQAHIRLGQVVEFSGGLFQELQQSVGIVGLDFLFGQFQVLVLQFYGFSLHSFSDHGGIEELGETVGEQYRGNGDPGNLQPVQFKAWLVVLDVLAGGQRDDRGIFESGCNQGMLDQAEIVGSTALSPGLGDGYRCLFGVILSGLESPDKVPHH